MIVIILETEATTLPQLSVAFQVWVTFPLQLPGVVVVNVDKFEVPLTKQALLSPFVNGSVLAAGKPPQVTVTSESTVIVGNAAGLTVIVLETDANVLPQLSVPVHVSVAVPPQAPGVTEKVEGFEVPLIEQPPDKPFEKAMELAAGKPPQATVIFARAVIVGNADGVTVIILETGAKALPQLSVAVHVSVIVPPQALGVAENVDGFDVPVIKHPPLKPLVNGIVITA